MKWNYLALLVVSVLLLSSCTQFPAETAKEINRTVEVEAQGTMLHYQGESYWSEDEFSIILENKDGFGSDLVEKFSDDLSRYGKHAINPEVEFNEVNKATTLTCDIEGAMYSTNCYDFHWLLGDLPFDLYAFQESEKELNYEGEVNGIPATIRLIFPYAITHCHEHVWPAG